VAHGKTAEPSGREEERGVNGSGDSTQLWKLTAILCFSPPLSTSIQSLRGESKDTLPTQHGNKNHLHLPTHTHLHSIPASLPLQQVGQLYLCVYMYVEGERGRRKGYHDD